MPTLLALLLEHVVGARFEHQPMEKVHWSCEFTFRGFACAVALEKFGLRLYVDQAAEGVDAGTILKKLNKSIAAAERYAFEPFVRSQTQAGNVVVQNLEGRLRAGYDHFRTRASAEKEGTELSWDGFHDGLAMLDAYFSWLEHVFVLLLPFAGYDRTTDDLVNFISAKWGDKYRRILGLNGDAERARYEAIHDIKERLRNTFAHGGFEKGGASLYVQVDHHWPIPARMTGVVDSPLFRIVALDRAEFEEVCKLLDSFDAYLSERFPTGMLYARSGIDLPFSADYLKRLLEHAGDLSAFGDWLDGMAQYADAMQNGDF
ncbi:MAG: hypothetical protein Q8P41_26955 [Pseudomonadota bacterium]|nr:hypothetical protein [Pseudomonadota bacterium]